MVVGEDKGVFRDGREHMMLILFEQAHGFHDFGKWRSTRKSSGVESFLTFAQSGVFICMVPKNFSLL